MRTSLLSSQNRTRLQALLLTTLLIAVSGLATVHADGPALWIRYPAVSPDGEAIVFSYKGDLYTVPATGGTASPLTLYQGHDSTPVWSRDGKWIAFSSDRYGNLDVYIMPSTGGEATRLTFHSADDFPSDFSPDGSSIIFSSTRTDSAASTLFPRSGLTELYEVPVDGGRVRQLLTIPAQAARFDSTGNRVIYQDRKGIESIWRKHHRTAPTRDIMIWNRSEGSFQKVSAFDGEDLSPLFTPDGKSIAYISESSGTLNVVRASLDDPSTIDQLTAFERHPVRFLSGSDDGTLVFTWDGGLYRLTPGASAPERIPVSIAVDTVQHLAETHSLGDATEMSPSDDGRQIAFVVRGDVFVASTESGLTKQITSTPEQERMVDFAPDGRSIVYAGERNGSWNLYRAGLGRADEKYFFNATVLVDDTILANDEETFQPTFSPDGKEISYLENRTTLRVLNLASKESRTVLPGHHNLSYADGDQAHAWSPDGKWFLVQYIQPGYWNPEIGLVSASGSGEIRNLTLSGYPDLRPTWAMKGKMLLWLSSRDGLRSEASSSLTEADAYGLFFTREAYDRFRLSKEEFEILEEAEKKAKEDAEKDEKDDKKKKDEPEAQAITIDLDGIQDRKSRLTIHSSRLADAVVTPDGAKLIYLARFDKGFDLWQTEIRTKETKLLLKLGVDSGKLALDAEGKTLFLLADGSLSKITIADGSKKPISFSGTMELDSAAERAYLFEHVWRQVREKFYAADFHGADWVGLRADYEKFLPHIGNNYDFSEMLSELLGELDASHTGAGYRPRPDNPDETAALGAIYDESWTGDGLRIAEVVAKGPLVQNGSRIKAGTVIEKLDGKLMPAAANPWPLFNRIAGRKVRLTLLDPETKARWEETVTPISPNSESELLYDRWVEGRRKQVERLSDGRLGYVHVRSMSDSSYRVVIEEVLGREVSKEGLVVDTRFNGGGDLVDTLSTFLAGRKYMDFTFRNDGRVIGSEPQFKWTKPSIVIASEGNYSDAHCFPYAYQVLEIGKVVGMPVAGTCTFVWWERLQDRTLVFGIPNMAVEGINGEILERLQLEPDIRVENDPASVIAGRDLQLERAVAELLKQVEPK